MGLIQNFVKSMKGEKSEFKEKFKDAQQEDKVRELIEERKKSANQRELEKYMKQREEDNIKRQLDIIHKKQNEELWKGKNSILAEKTTMLNNDRPILKEKSIFQNNKNIFKNGNTMGFWK